MAEEPIHRQRFNISSLKARSVTIYPLRAAVVRDIEDVVILVSRFPLTGRTGERAGRGLRAVG